MSALKPVLVRQLTGTHFLTVEEVAELLRLRPRTIYNMVSQGRIPYRKAGRLLLFEQKEIDEWTKAGARKP